MDCYSSESPVKISNSKAGSRQITGSNPRIKREEEGNLYHAYIYFSEK
jgi:hypothetical protein